MVGNIVVFCTLEVFQLPEILHLSEILFDFRAQLKDLLKVSKKVCLIFSGKRYTIMAHI